MDASTINSLVGSLGFPIVMCGLLYYGNLTQAKQHKEEMDKMTEAINNNTVALTNLIAKINEKG